MYAWNAENLLTEVKRGPSVDTATSLAKFYYDSVGNRVQKVEPVAGNPDKVTAYLVDETFPHAETLLESVRQGDATESTSYVWGIKLIEQLRGGKGTFYHADGSGSVRALTDERGSKNATYQFNAFGKLEEFGDDGANAYRYTGQYFDDTIGLQYNRARWYDAEAGRFISFDSFVGKAADPITLNKFAYAHGDPVNLTDPSGLSPTNLTETTLVTEVQNARASGQTAVFQVTMRKTGCFAITRAVSSVLDEGIYIFMDSALGMPYVGRTTQGIDTRISQHVSANMRTVVKPLMARFHISSAIQGDVLARLEQSIIRAFGVPGRKPGGPKTLSNAINAINKAKRVTLQKLCP